MKAVPKKGRKAGGKGRTGQQEELHRVPAAVHTSILAKVNA